MSETQLTITEWADETFGKSVSNLRVATRANEEMAELLKALSIDEKSPKALEEVADVVIVLCRLATNLGGDINAEITRKMEINRNRTWNRDSSGHGYHAKAKETR